MQYLFFTDFYKREEVFFRLGIIYKLQGKADASLEVGLSLYTVSE